MLDREVLNICFLQLCKINNIIPHFLKYKDPSIDSHFGPLNKKFEKDCLNNIRRKFKLVDCISSKVFNLYGKLTKTNLMSLMNF